MASACSGWRSTYSVIEGLSPWRRRRANSSARRSTGLRSALESGMSVSASIEEPGDGREDVPQSFERPDVAVARRRLLDAEHRRRLVVAQFLEVAQHQDLAVKRVH